MTSNKFDGELGLVQNFPKLILNKLGINQGALNQSGNIEVIIISGDNVDNITEFVDNLGGKYENLGYNFGIVNIPINKIQQLAANTSIQYIELPKSLYTTDINSNRAACVDVARRTFGIEGEGVLIGFIDSGIDYTHYAFRNEDGTTRIEYIYDISEGGKIYNKDMINEALKSSDPYSIVSSYDVSEHGTHVAGIACAGGRINPDFYGVAPRSSIAMVKCTRGKFALSTNIMRGLKFLIDKSKELKMPLSVNISLSTNDGAHNGTSLLEKYISTVATLEQITISIAAGNEGEASHHIGGELLREQKVSLNVSGDENGIIINLYKDLLPEITLRIISPTGVSSGDIDIREGYKEGNIGVDKYQIYSTGAKPFDINGEVVISLSSNNKYISSGQWDIILIVTNKYTGLFNMWLPISEGLNTKTKFLQPTVLNTLGIPATVFNIISVGCYNYNTNNISPFSGRGKPVIFETPKPDLVAPGVEVISAAPNNSFDSKTGTSMATPHVAGIAALLMEWGIIRGNDPYLYGERLKYHLIKGAKRSRTDIKYPDPSWGYGEICLYNTLEEIIRTLGIATNIRSREVIDKEAILKNKKNGMRYINQDIIDKYKESTEKVGFIVEYTDNESLNDISKIQGASVIDFKNNFAIVRIQFNRINEVEPYVKEIITIEIPVIYTLSEISPLEAIEGVSFHNNSFLNLSGKGVVIGILDTGIDYLNQEFIREDDTSRVISIWDQSINGEANVDGVDFGKEYSNEEINKAIKLKKTGGDPYTIVPSKDEIGHGTMIAGLAGANGKNPNLIGVAPDCDLAIVKLKEAPEVILDYAGVTKIGKGRYTTVDVLLGLRYLSRLIKKIKKPMVILLPLSTNIGGHDGSSVIEVYIDEISKQLGIVCVTGVGNQGDTDTHTEGKLEITGEAKSLELKVGKGQKNINFQIFIAQPDRVSIGVVSPSGEVIERIPIRLGKVENVKFLYEKTNIRISYVYPDIITGDEVINIECRDLKEGIWKFILYGDHIVDGRYWSWLPQRSLIDSETKFLNPSQYTTLGIPSTSNTGIAAAFYNQNNNSTVGQSGRGFTRDNRVKPDIAAGGINALVIKPGGGTAVASGSSVATAILAGCCALILQWGMIDKNDESLYATKIRTYIIGGARMRAGDRYPNKEWGYGILDIKGVFDAIRGSLFRNKENSLYDEFEFNGLFIRKPTDL
ncbi:S8 family serine peptidase [Clostridium carnis]